tara:strand:- start:11571 stop:11726 length:156 start_codon:yes stop_codon:yes gene_type:complete
MTRILVSWGLVLAGGAFALQWLEYQYLARAFSWDMPFNGLSAMIPILCRQP